MNLLFLALVGVICFGLILVGGREFRSSVLYTLAIGGAINSNFFHANAYPIMCFGLPFGIDSIIYTLFIFCVIVMFLKYNKKSAYVLTFSTIAGIVFAAIMQFVAEIASGGFELTYLVTFANYFISAVASLIAVYVMLKTMDALKKHNMNDYANIFIGIVIATIINSLLYYGLTAVVNSGLAENFWTVFGASIIGKLFALGLSLVTYAMLNRKEIKKTKKGNNSGLVQEEIE